MPHFLEDHKEEFYYLDGEGLEAGRISALLKLLVSANTNTSVCYRCISVPSSTAYVFQCIRYVSQRNLTIHVDRTLAFSVYLFVFF